MEETKMSFLDRLFGKKKEPSPKQQPNPERREEETDVLRAKPISKERMRLLWHDPSNLDILALTVEREDVVTLSLNDTGIHDWQPTAEDIAWAKKVNVFAIKATEASKREQYSQAIEFYRDALRLAPGCDLYLMSIGCCFGNMRRSSEGLPYLERAYQISPDNERIKRNLQACRNAARYGFY
jgi:tetratricopeptide (TPR) repeat protein